MRIMMPLFRIFLNPRFLFPLIVIWFRAPNPGRALKDFVVQNTFISGIFYGIMTAISLIITYREQTLVYSFNAVIFLVLSLLFLLIHTFLIFLFGRVHYPRSKRINWKKTFEPAKDLFIVWFVSAIVTGLLFSLILLISK